MFRDYEKLTPQEKMSMRRNTEDALNTQIRPYLYYRRSEMKKQKEFKSKFKTDGETFNFLQYTRLIYDWARVRYGVSRDQIDVLLYLHPLGFFNNKEVHEALRIFPCEKKWTIKKLRDKKMIVEYDKFIGSDGKAKVIYTLSHKAKRMINSIYKRIMGIEEFSTSPSEMWRMNQAGSKADNYDELLLKFNQKVRDKNKE